MKSLIAIAFSTVAILIAVSGRAAAQSIPVQLGPAEPLPRQLYTFNTDMATAIMFRGVGYDSQPFEDAVREIRPQGLRFPGGTLANNYLWTNDSFSEPTNDKTGWAAEHLKLFRKIGRPYDLPGFARVVRRNHVSPIWVLNVYEETAQSTLELFDKLDSLGLQVSAVEMANEPYWDGRSLADVRGYIAASRPIAEALRKHRPDVKIGACFAPFGNPANYEDIWNAPLSNEKWFDAIVFHEYYGGQGFALEAGKKVSVAAMLHPEAMIEEPVAKLGKLMPGKPIWFTEWNVGVEGLDQWKNTGAELQFIAATFASLVEHRDAIEIATFHAFYDSRFGAFYIDDETNQLETNASYELFRLLGIAFADADTLRRVTLTSDDLRGFATGHGDELCLFMLNRGDTNSDLTLSESFRGELRQTTLDCTPDRKLSPSTRWGVTQAIDKNVVTLPAHSISLIGPREALQFAPKTTDDDNLFPRRPDLLFWYPPYASEQPRFDASGVYAVDLGKCKDQSLAVVKMNLASSGLTEGRQYSIELEAKSSVDGGLIVKLPQAGTSDGRYSVLGREFGGLRYTFEFDPTSNDGEVAIVFPQDLIAKDSIIELRKFRISAVE